MKSLRWLAGLFLALVLGSASCAKSPEAFCTAWVDESCGVLAGCCTGGASFDLASCREVLSIRCQSQTQAEAVRAGNVVFDSGAASDCLAAVTSCAAPVVVDPVAHARACANMLTGSRPLGAACEASTQCEKAGDLAECYSGIFSAYSRGLCAKVVLDDDTCSYSLETNELHLCSEGKHCDLSRITATPGATSVTAQLVFSARCQDDVALGESCIDPSNDTDVLTCATGLFCDVTGGSAAVCAARKGEGAACTDSLPRECQQGLGCTGTPHQCQGLTPPAEFCFVTPKCGDGHCDPGETPTSCPADCSADTCGDGKCSPGEVLTCPQDCMSCVACACQIPTSEGGCSDVCSQAQSGGTVPDLCDGLAAQASCKACVAAQCGQPDADLCARP